MKQIGADFLAIIIIIIIIIIDSLKEASGY